MQNRDEPSGISGLIAQQIEAYFAAHEGDLQVSGLYARMIREIEKPLFAATLSACAGNQLRAAQILGINRNTLRKKLRELGLLAPSTLSASSLQGRKNLSLREKPDRAKLATGGKTSKALWRRA